MRGCAIFGIVLALLARAASAAPGIVAVDVDGVVHPVTAEIVAGAIARAHATQASLLLVRINTPGGPTDAMEKTIQELLASPVPVVTYVTPSGGRAASAGFFLLQAGDVAAMAPGTSAATYLVAGKVAGLRLRQGRHGELAKTAIRQGRGFTEREALDQHQVDLVAADEAQLLLGLDGRAVTRADGSTVTLHTAGAPIDVYRRSWRQRIISALSDPNIALVLLVAGMLAIYVEFNSPGLIVPGVAGAVLVLMGLSALSVLPLNWRGAALLALAATLLVLEAKFACHAILGAGGAAAMALGLVLLVDSPLPELQVHWGTALALSLPFSLITVLLLSLAVRARRNKDATGGAGIIGQTGNALTPLAPRGKVVVRGEYWDAVSVQPVAAGARVRVTAIENLRLRVEALSG